MPIVTKPFKNFEEFTRWRYKQSGLRRHDPEGYQTKAERNRPMSKISGTYSPGMEGVKFRNQLTDKQIMDDDTQLLFDAKATQRGFELGKWTDIASYAKWRGERMSPFLRETDPYAYVRNIDWSKVATARAFSSIQDREARRRRSVYGEDSGALPNTRPEPGREAQAAIRRPALRGFRRRRLAQQGLLSTKELLG